MVWGKDCDCVSEKRVSGGCSGGGRLLVNLGRTMPMAVVVAVARSRDRSTEGIAARVCITGGVC